MLDNACSNTAIETLSKVIASVLVDAAKEKVPPVPAAAALLAVLNAFEVRSLASIVNADSRIDLWMLILVPVVPLLLVKILMVLSSVLFWFAPPNTVSVVPFFSV